MNGKHVTEVHGFTSETGWLDPLRSGEISRSFCESLEDGTILFIPTLPCEMARQDLEFLHSLEQSDTATHKNISYRPKEDILHGFSASKPEEEKRMHRIMRTYSRGVVAMLGKLLFHYADKWSLDYASYRPYEEENRKLPLHKRHDLVHTDAFPSRPTRGGLILRCFTNINSHQPRVWLTTERFPSLARRYAEEVGLSKIIARQASPLHRVWKNLKGIAGLPAAPQTAYDLFMRRFHDYLKENHDFQSHSEKFVTDFPPHSTWITFTDIVPHAVLSGRYALEQTFIVPVDALFDPAKSPVRVLEEIAGQSLIS
ncbi:MAG: Kdo hydroxylase family protein [Methylacidiphilales bacterium]|nr:Kdo hydroxylase family protein [Candidatus Methylacidiphilales bacterium]